MVIHYKMIRTCMTFFLFFPPYINIFGHISMKKCFRIFSPVRNAAINLYVHYTRLTAFILYKLIERTHHFPRRSPFYYCLLFHVLSLLDFLKGDENYVGKEKNRVRPDSWRVSYILITIADATWLCE